MSSWLKLTPFTYVVLTVNPQKRPTCLNLFFRLQMRVLLEFAYLGKISKNAGLIGILVLFKGGSLSRIYGIQILTCLVPHFSGIKLLLLSGVRIEPA